MKKTTLFKSGNSQAMRIPKEFRFTGDNVYIEKFGPIAIVVDSNDPWAALKIAHFMISDDFFKDGRQQSNQQIRPEIERLFK